ncbi:MAG: immunity 43 family protein, partial [Prevotellaceae bacterium]|nr:immunity 43 family protein [Prevotellaceae bacterium]
NSDLKENESDDYSWNTTLAKKVNFPQEFWLVFDTSNLVFDYAKYSTLFLVSKTFLDVIEKYCSENIQYVKVNMVKNKTESICEKQYYFLKFTEDSDYIDYENSIVEQKYDYITKTNQIIKYLNIKLKEQEIDKDIFVLRNNILGQIIYISAKVKNELIKQNLNNHIHIIPVEDVANFHNEYYFL